MSGHRRRAVGAPSRASVAAGDVAAATVAGASGSALRAPSGTRRCGPASAGGETSASVASPTSGRAHAGHATSSAVQRTRGTAWAPLRTIRRRDGQRSPCGQTAHMSTPPRPCPRPAQAGSRRPGPGSGAARPAPRRFTDEQREQPVGRRVRVELVAHDGVERRRGCRGELRCRQPAAHAVGEERPDERRGTGPADRDARRLPRPAPPGGERSPPRSSATPSPVVAVVTSTSGRSRAPGAPARRAGPPPAQARQPRARRAAQHRPQLRPPSAGRPAGRPC